MTEIDVVVFDMGGVLVKLGSLPQLLGHAGSADDFWPRWLSSPAVRRFERGGCAPEVFAADLVAELELTVDADRFLANFNAFCQGLFPGAAQLVTDTGAHCRTALLSNTNALHWNHQPDAATIQTLCDVNFLSFELGCLKPDRKIFDRVAGALDVAPAKILFLDDNEINVTAARGAGWSSEVARGPAAAGQVLRNWRIPV